MLDILQQLQKIVFLIFDEFDKVQPDVKLKFSYTIKALSDNSPHVTLFIVGVAENVSSLINEHQSLERCIKQISLQRMSDDELSLIIDKGLNFLEMSIEEYVKNKIVSFSEGFPQYTHLLAKYATKTAIDVSATEVQKQHFDIAIDEAIENAEQTIRSCYQKAIDVNRSSHVSFEEIVFACALIESQNSDGFFTPADVLRSLSKITKKDLKNSSSYSYYLDQLCLEGRGQILQKNGFNKKYKYKFSSPLVKAFVNLKMYRSLAKTSM